MHSARATGRSEAGARDRDRPLEPRSDAVEAELTNIGDPRRRGGQIFRPAVSVDDRM